MRHHELAFAIRMKLLGPDHYDVGLSLLNLGGESLRRARHDEALERFQRSAAIWEKTSGADNPDLAYPLTGAARALLALGRVEDGRAAAERAVALREAGDAIPAELALSRFVLAQALAKRDRPRAIALARQARAAFVEAGPAASAELAELDAWLAKAGVSSAR